MGVLLLFGLCINSLFDLWKLLPTAFQEGPLVPDRWNLFLDLTPPVLLLGIVGAYLLFRNQTDRWRPNVDRLRVVSPHKGIVLALSIPMTQGEKRILPEEVIATIESTPLDKIETLYTIRGIGQLFKGIYHHQGFLMHVWPLYTDHSAPYKACIEAFLAKFMNASSLIRHVRIRDDDGCCSLKGNKDGDLLDEMREKLKHIYSSENLAALELKSEDIIVDITGGTKIMSIGMTFGALDSAIDIQYVEQKDYQVIPLSITVDAILDKVSIYLLELASSRQPELKKSKAII